MSTTVDRRQVATRVPAESVPPQRLGPWVLVRRVAVGPACDVYQARAADASSSAPASYALKILRPEWNDRPEAVALIQREAVVGRSVSHRHLVAVLGAQLERPPYFVVTPWLEGATLDRHLQAGELPPLATALWIARQTAEALDALHASGWIHGDIKPANMLLSPRMHGTLLDLGFARRHGETGTAANRFGLGTPLYLAPETVTSQTANDIRSDIYSLGAMLFHLLTGRPPFAGDSLESIVTAHRTETPPRLRSLRPTLPSEVAELVHSMLAKDPLRRPQSPRELLSRLVRLEIDALGERF